MTTRYQCPSCAQHISYRDDYIEHGHLLGCPTGLGGHLDACPVCSTVMHVTHDADGTPTYTTPTPTT